MNRFPSSFSGWLRYLQAGLLLTTCLLCSKGSIGEERFAITVRVRPTSSVTQPTVTMGDVAIIESAKQQSDDTAVLVKQIVLIDDLTPGSETSLNANQILDKLRANAIEPATLGYSIPERVIIRRVGRELTRAELQDSLNEFLRGTGREVSLGNFSHDGSARMFPGASTVRIVSLQRQRVGISRIVLEARSDSGETARMTVVGQLDEFMYVPVASRQIPPGNVVKSGDVIMARMDVSKMPRDAAAQAEGVVGHSVKRVVSAGDPFRSPDLALPQDVVAGSFVVLRYVGTGFTATATGVALDPGRVGGVIRVRNDSSKRVVQGSIVEPGLVEVK